MAWRFISRPAAMAASVVLAASLLVSCANQPSMPAAMGVPAPPAPQVFPTHDRSTKVLDCISAELHRAGYDGEKRHAIALGPLINETIIPNTGPPPKINKTDLPLSLKGFARASVSRLTSGFRYFDVTPDTPMRNVPVRLDGSIYHLSPFRTIDVDAEALGFGLGARIEATDVLIQLWWSVRAKGSNDYELNGSSVTVTLRVYSTEQGASAFRITSASNGLLMARARSTQDASPHFAMQEIVGLMIAHLVRNYAERYMGVYASCNFDDTELVSPGPSGANPAALLDIRLEHTAGRVCALVQPREVLTSQSTGPLVLKVTERRGEGIKIRERTMEMPPLRTILENQAAMCLSKGAFDGNAEQVVFELSTRQGRVLGRGGLHFQ